MHFLLHIFDHGALIVYLLNLSLELSKLALFIKFSNFFTLFEKLSESSICNVSWFYHFRFLLTQVLILIEFLFESEIEIKQSTNVLLFFISEFSSWIFYLIFYILLLFQLLKYFWIEKNELEYFFSNFSLLASFDFPFKYLFFCNFLALFLNCFLDFFVIFQV